MSKAKTQKKTHKFNQDTFILPCNKAREELQSNAPELDNNGVCSGLSKFYLLGGYCVFKGIEKLPEKPENYFEQQRNLVHNFSVLIAVLQDDIGSDLDKIRDIFTKIGIMNNKGMIALDALSDHKHKLEDILQEYRKYTDPNNQHKIKSEDKFGFSCVYETQEIFKSTLALILIQNSNKLRVTISSHDHAMAFKVLPNKTIIFYDPNNGIRCFKKTEHEKFANFLYERSLRERSNKFAPISKGFYGLGLDEKKATQLREKCFDNNFPQNKKKSKRRGINRNTHDGITPLYSAAENGHLDVVKFLVQHGADKENITKALLATNDESIKKVLKDGLKKLRHQRQRIEGISQNGVFGEKDPLALENKNNLESDQQKNTQKEDKTPELNQE